MRFLVCTYLLTVLAGAQTSQNDTILKQDFCQAYYTGKGDCNELVKKVRANHSRTLPTLEMGDPANPMIMFFHGWPDNTGIWANQFEMLCAPPNGKFFCVAPSWFNFHPQFPSLPVDELLWDKQVEAFKMVVDEIGATKIILIVHDFGSLLGYQFAYKYPDLVTRMISLDIGDDPTPDGTDPATIPPNISSLMAYQQTNIKAFLHNDDSAMRQNSFMAPCKSCSFIQARIGWPYYQFIRNGSDEWHHRLAPSISPSKWKLSLTPSFPDHIPLLFLYSKCLILTGGTMKVPCVPNPAPFHTPAFETWVNSRPGSKAIGIKSDHWIQVRGSSLANEEIAKWMNNAPIVVL